MAIIFDPKTIRCFRFVAYDYNAETTTASFHYAFDQHYEFTETLTFQQAPALASEAQTAAFNRTLKFLHLMLGVSYYKAAIPPEIVIETGDISKAAADFFNHIYFQGLGEFAYQNQLKLNDYIHFPYNDTLQDNDGSNDYSLPQRYCIPIGGGKDSIVTLSSLQQAYQCGEMETAPILFSLGKHQPIEATIAVSGLERILVTRQISKTLLELNQQGAYNGHVPISAMIAFVLAASSILYGFDAAALSNERSANVGNLDYEGREVNHQFSKSYTFERDIHDFFQKHVVASFRYFSFLRPLSELHIAKLFAQQSDYHSVFTSCNRAFRMVKNKQDSHWCLDCPKCRFVFLMLAPFMPKQDLRAIFGKNLLEDQSQNQGYDELFGLEGHKPFECVGEIEESQAALFLLARQDEWADSELIKNFIGRICVPAQAIMAKLETSMQKGKSMHHMEHNIMDLMQEALRSTYTPEKIQKLINDSLALSDEHQLTAQELAWLYAAIRA